MSLLDVQDLTYAYGGAAPVLKGVSFRVDEGDSVGLVGESGSGKTTLLRLLLGLARPAEGRITFDGAPLDPGDRRFMRAYRRQVQTVFQDPYSSLDPRQKVGDIVAEPLRALRLDRPHGPKVAAALDEVSLPPDAIHRYPHEFSGGQRQRIAIARAIVPGPRLLLADEPVSALDLSTRTRIVELLAGLQHRMSLLMVSHDLAVVAALCARIIVLEKGRIVEDGPTREVLTAPRHPYTRALISSVPRLPKP